jgi:alpha-beta hydrolase superfamily lysophospholipase
MANIVLVHGAWHGGWCYRHTAAALRKMGHEVFTPTHTGSASALIRQTKTLPWKPIFAMLQAASKRRKSRTLFSSAIPMVAW